MHLGCWFPLLPRLCGVLMLSEIIVWATCISWQCRSQTGVMTDCLLPSPLIFLCLCWTHGWFSDGWTVILWYMYACMLDFLFLCICFVVWLVFLCVSAWLTVWNLWISVAWTRRSFLIRVLYYIRVQRSARCFSYGSSFIGAFLYGNSRLATRLWSVDTAHS